MTPPGVFFIYEKTTKSFLLIARSHEAILRSRTGLALLFPEPLTYFYSFKGRFSARQLPDRALTERNLSESAHV